MNTEMQTGNKIFLEQNNLVVTYSDGDIIIIDHVKNLSTAYPLQPKTSIVALCNCGSLSMSVNGVQMKLKANDVLFCPPNVKMEDFDISDDFECKVLCLTENVIQGLLYDKISVWNHAIYVNELNIISMSTVCQQEFDYYYALIRSKIDNHRENPVNEIILTLVRALLLELVQILESRQGMNDDVKLSQGRMLFNRFLRNISDSSVKRRPINEYASELAITPKYLTMLCLKYSGKTASDWIVQYTTEDIRFYLKSSNMSIKEISAKLGFANMSHFGSYVRKHLGKSPSDFRHQK
jgi:AraC-like DNA-binding protein